MLFYVKTWHDVSKYGNFVRLNRFIMRFITFKTPQPKRFRYKPRYFDEEKDALEQKKAAMGYDSKLTHTEDLRLQMSRRWRKSGDNTGKSVLSRTISYAFYGTFIIGGIYLIFFTDFVNKLIALFGVK